MTPDLEVVLMYHVPVTVERPSTETIRLPHKQLVDFRRVSLDAGGTTSLDFTLAASKLGLVDSKGNTVLYGGTHKFIVSRGNGDDLAAPVEVKTASPVTIDTLL